MSRTFKSVFGATGERKSADQEESASPSGSEGSTAESDALNRSVMVLGKSLVFKGELSAEEDTIFFGRLEGTLNHAGSFTVGAGGVVIGDIRARHITIKGSVEGDLYATDGIVVSPTASVTGDLRAPRVTIVEGARFNGSVDMPAPPVREAPSNEATPPASGNTALSDVTVDGMLTDK